MTRSDPTGRAYRDALVDLRGKAPEAADAVVVHVRHLERLLARMQVEQQQLEARVKELASIKLDRNASELEADLLIVTNDQEVVAMTSAPQIVEAAMHLIGQITDPEQDSDAALAAAAVTHGPVAGSVFLVALQAVARGVETVQQAEGGA